MAEGVTTTVASAVVGLVSLPTAAIAASWSLNSTLLIQPCSGRVAAPRGTRAVAAVQCRRASRSRTVVAKAAMKALVFDCDGEQFSISVSISHAAN
jgi:hypothetical protein